MLEGGFLDLAFNWVLSQLNRPPPCYGTQSYAGFTWYISLSTWDLALYYSRQRYLLGLEFQWTLSWVAGTVGKFPS